MAGTAFAEEKGPKTSDINDRVKSRMESRVTVIASTTVERVQAEREKMQSRVASTTSRIKDRAEEMRQKAEDRMTEIQDKLKQQMAKRLATQFTGLNKTWTDHFAKLLDRYTGIVQKMQDRATIAAASGKDVATASAAIEAAKTAIATAQAAVIAQAAKTYTLDVTTIATTTATSTRSGQEEFKRGLKTAFQNLHNALFRDLFALRDGPMKDARKAVQSALRTLGQVPGVDEDTENRGTATSTGAN